MSPAATRLAALALLLAPAVTAAQLPPDAFVDEVLPIDEQVLATVGALLPELPNAGAAFAHKGSNIVLTAPGEVTVVLLRDGSDWRNTLGSCVVTGNPPVIGERQLVFSDTSMQGSGGSLPLGAAVRVRDATGNVASFSAGTLLGLFVVADGAKTKEVASWNGLTATVPSLDPAVNASVGRGVFSTGRTLNPPMAAGRPDVAQHAAVFHVPGLVGGQDALVVGFELLDRTDPRSDHDFNDLVVLLLGPGFSTTSFADSSPDDLDGDGVPGSDDSHPHDPARAAVTRFPGSGFELFGLDDGYPLSGDGDLNDTVLATAFELVTNADGDVVEVLGELHLLARGSASQHLLGMHVPGLPAGDQGTIAIEAFLGPLHATHVMDELVIADVVAQDDRRIEVLLPASGAALPAVEPGQPVNTTGTVDRTAASVRARFLFETPIAPDVLGAPPWDLYWLVEVPGIGVADVHLPGVDAFADRPPGLPLEQGPSAFLDDHDRPWFTSLGRGTRFALEGIDFASLYPAWVKWAASKGALARDWDRKSKAKSAAPAPAAFLKAETWAVDVTAP